MEESFSLSKCYIKPISLKINTVLGFIEVKYEFSENEEKHVEECSSGMIEINLEDYLNKEE